MAESGRTRQASHGIGCASGTWPCNKVDGLHMRARPAVGVGYRHAIAGWMCEHLDSFDVLEVTIDHCIHGSHALRSTVFDLAERIPMTAHGIGLSIGTDVPINLRYLDEVAAVVDRIKAPAYS